ncbi:MAG: TetR/AcrR family transcriptional regulator, partial [Campylobacterales bacterium]|nr:TetR/AcrR family transcriptional regulator [Campylobacterales bacterium]
SLTQSSEEIQAFLTTTHQHYYQWFCQILQEGIDRGEIKPIALDLAKGLFVLGDGFFVSSTMTGKMQNIEEEINLHIDTIFKLIEVKQ